MTDFQMALLWIRSLEVVVGHSLALVLSELGMDLFSLYRSPLKA